MILRNAFCLLIALLVPACAQPSPVRPPEAAKAPPARPQPATIAYAPTGPVNVPLVAEAAARVEEMKRLRPDWNEADRVLNMARDAANIGYAPRARSLAQQALTRANIAINGHYSKLAGDELAKSSSYTGLADSDVTRQQYAQTLALRGQSKTAYGLLRTLNDELEHARTTYTVRRNETLWSIAGKPEVYNNPWLWPLIWHANAGTLPDPRNLTQGQVLKIRPHPTIDEVVQAREYSHKLMAGQIRIGTIKKVSESE